MCTHKLPTPCQGIEAGFDMLRSAVDGSGNDGRPKLLAGHTCRLQQALIISTGLPELLLDEFAQRVRTSAVNPLNHSRSCTGLSISIDRPCPCQVVDDAAHEERVAIGPLVQELCHLRRKHHSWETDVKIGFDLDFREQWER